MNFITYSNKIGAKGEPQIYDYNDYKERFNSTTYTNLYYLTRDQNIIWEKVIITPVNIQKRYNNHKNSRIGIDIKIIGKNNKKEEFTYHRSEPGGRGSGQTKLYKWGRYPIQVSKARIMTIEEFDYHFRKAKPKKDK
jgi:hypothetical protein